MTVQSKIEIIIDEVNTETPGIYMDVIDGDGDEAVIWLSQQDAINLAQRLITAVHRLGLSQQDTLNLAQRLITAANRLGLSQQ